MIIAQWAVGFLVILLVSKVVKLEASGIMAWIILTILPWGIGKFLFELVAAIGNR